MRKKRKCEACGGAFMYKIQNSAYERENRYLLTWPYCSYKHYLVIEDGRLIDQEKGSKYLKNLPAIPIPTQPWLEIFSKE